LAVIYGSSGAERDLITLAGEQGFRLESLQEFESVRKELVKTLSDKAAETRRDINREVFELRERSKDIREAIEKRSREAEEDIKREMEVLKKEIDALDVEFGLKNIFSFIVSFIKRWRKKRRYNYLRSPAKEIRKRLKQEYKELEVVEERLDYLEHNTNEEIDRRLRSLKNEVERINRIGDSREYKGALGEVRVIRQLEKLPDDYYVFNDLTMKLKTWAEFRGKKLKSAQIDHLVVGPTGVYVIETKNWSEKYVNGAYKDDSYNPYDQISRGSYVVYRNLNPGRYGNFLQKVHYKFANKEIKVKSVVAVCGSKLPLEGKGYAKVMHPERIPDYILNSRSCLPEDRIKMVVKKCR
jgi:hypothetical protein